MADNTPDAAVMELIKAILAIYDRQIESQKKMIQQQGETISQQQAAINSLLFKTSSENEPF